MPTVDVYNTDAEKVDSIALDDAIFGTEVKEHLFHAAVPGERKWCQLP